MERIEVNASTALAGVAGLLVGGATAGGVAYLLLRKSFNRRLDGEVAAVKAHYNERLKEAVSGILSDIPDAGHPFVGEPHRRADLAGEGSDNLDGEAALGDGELAEDLQLAVLHITDPLEGLDDGEEEPEEPGDEGNSSPLALIDRDIRKPYVLTEAEFADSPPGWQAITIKYYASDKVLVDDKDDPIPNFGKIVGPIYGPQDFGGVSGDPHLRYVRNQALETDFEILLHAGSYADDVLNYGQPNRER